MQRSDAVEGTWFYRLVRFVWGSPVRRYFKVSCTGMDNIPAEGPFILAANHASYLDPLVIGATCPRPVHFMMIRRFWNMPLVGWASRMGGSFPVDEGRVSGQTLRRALGVLRSGCVLGIFPEGGITNDGRLQPAREGVARLALRAGVPVVPAGITGTRAAYPKGRLFPRPLPVAVRYGEAIASPPEDRNPAALREQSGELTERIMDRIGALLSDGGSVTAD